jgi:hypothetical protein
MCHGRIVQKRRSRCSQMASSSARMTWFARCSVPPMTDTAQTATGRAWRAPRTGGGLQAGTTRAKRLCGDIREDGASAARWRRRA